MFERFTPESRQVVVRAQEHARRLHHGWIGCEHVLVGVAESPSSAGALFRDRGAQPAALSGAILALIGQGPGDNDDKVALAGLGIDLDEVRQAVEANFGPGSLESTTTRWRRRRLGGRRAHCRVATGNLPFTSRAKRCLELSLRESLRLKHGFIGVEHIALALLARDDTVAWEVLVRIGIDPSELRRGIEASLGRTA